MEPQPNELYLFFDPNTSQGKKTRAYALAQAPHVKFVELDKEPLTPRLWKQIIDNLPESPAEVLDMDPDAMEGEDWYTYLNANPTKVKHPIALHGDKAKLCTNPADIATV